MLGHYTLTYLSDYIFIRGWNNILGTLFYATLRCKKFYRIGPWSEPVLFLSFSVSDLIYPTCEAFSRLFHGHHDTLIKQVNLKFGQMASILSKTHRVIKQVNLKFGQMASSILSKTHSSNSDHLNSGCPKYKHCPFQTLLASGIQMVWYSNTD